MTDSAVARLRDTRVQFSDNIAKPSPGDPIPLIGYVDKLSARPGETLQFKVGGSSDGQEATARLMQVICADANPDGPGICEKDLSKIFQLDFKTKAKSLAMGSYVVTNPSRQQQLKIRDSLVGGCTLVATICPTLPDEGQQAIISCWDDDSKDGIMLGIAPGKGATLTVGVAPRAQPQRAKATSVSVGRSLKKHVWYVVWATFDPEKDQASVGQFRVHSPCHDDVADEGWAHMQVPQGFQTIISGTSPPTLAAAVASPSRLLEAKFHFNGKMESPTIYDVAFDASTKTMRQAAAGELVLGLTARWAFDKGISGLHVTDSGDHGLHGTVVNLPTRGVKGSLWSGREHCWRHAPEEYNAIHFHSDDLDDARWDTDFAFTIPQDLPSGAYCMRLRSGAHHDTIPFFVLAALGDAQADLCVVIPTFTYVIYGNHARNDFQADDWHLRASCSEGAYLHNPAEHVEHYGASTYNLHKDGSGICHCTHRRPLLTLKSGFRSITEPGSGVRHFQADTHLLAWLFAQEIAFEVVTDHDLHHEGADCILPYRAVMTCTHPEYHTKESLDALCGYRDKGGRLLYLGGNGFYWRVAVHAEMPGAIEIRRGEGGIRAWASSPGEYYNAFDGQYVL